MFDEKSERIEYEEDDSRTTTPDANAPALGADGWPLPKPERALSAKEIAAEAETLRLGYEAEDAFMANDPAYNAQLDAEEVLRTLGNADFDWGGGGIYVRTATGHSAYAFTPGPDIGVMCGDIFYIAAKYTAKTTASEDDGRQWMRRLAESGRPFQSVECRSHLAFVRFKNANDAYAFVDRPLPQTEGERLHVEVGDRSVLALGGIEGHQRELVYALVGLLGQAVLRALERALTSQLSFRLSYE